MLKLLPCLTKTFLNCLEGYEKEVYFFTFYSSKILFKRKLLNVFNSISLLYSPAIYGEVYICKKSQNSH